MSKHPSDVEKGLQPRLDHVEYVKGYVGDLLFASDRMAEKELGARVKRTLTATLHDTEGLEPAMAQNRGGAGEMGGRSASWRGINLTTRSFPDPTYYGCFRGRQFSLASRSLVNRHASLNF